MFRLTQKLAHGFTDVIGESFDDEEGSQSEEEAQDRSHMTFALDIPQLTQTDVSYQHYDQRR